MRKLDQNILAQNSTGEILYICGKCGKPVDKEATICPHCSAKLGDIKCPFCGFTGGLDDFKEDTCPRCGRKRAIPVNYKKRKFIAKKTNNSNYFYTKYFWIIFLGLLGIFFGLLFFLYNAL